MCDCITKLQNDKKEDWGKILKEKEKLTLEKIDFKDVTFGFSERDGKANMWMRTSSTVELTVSERKRPIKQTLVHTYCPFCGERYEQKKE